MSLNKIIENEHFIINYNDKDEACINNVLKILEDNYLRITKSYKKGFDKKLGIEIYNDFEELHNALGLMKGAPDWIRGGLRSNGIIAIASPLNPPPKSNFDNVLSTAVHEFVHIIVYKINTDIPRWLNEGIASFEGKDNNFNWIEKTLKEGINNNIVPTMKSLDTGNDFELFFKKNGYQYSYSIVEWIISEFGYDKLLSLIKNSGDFEKTFSISQNEAEEMWKSFIQRRYS